MNRLGAWGVSPTANRSGVGSHRREDLEPVRIKGGAVEQAHEAGGAMA
jgi:hypothetical protein